MKRDTGNKQPVKLKRGGRGWERDGTFVSAPTKPSFRLVPTTTVLLLRRRTGSKDLRPSSPDHHRLPPFRSSVYACACVCVCALVHPLNAPATPPSPHPSVIRSIRRRSARFTDNAAYARACTRPSQDQTRACRHASVKKSKRDEVSSREGIEIGLLQLGKKGQASHTETPSSREAKPIGSTVLSISQFHETSAIH